MLLRLLYESLRRGGRRKLLAATSVALGVLASTALVEVLLASGDRLAAELASYGANLEVLPATGEGGTFEAAHLAALREIFWTNNVVAFAPLLDLRVGLAVSGGAAGAEAAPAAVPAVVAPVVGTWFDVALPDGFRTGLPRVRPALTVDGRWPRDLLPATASVADAAPAEVALGRRLAERLGVVAGDRLTATLAGERRVLTVVGVVAGGGPEEERAFAPLAAVQALAGRPGAARSGSAADGLPGGPVTRAEVFALTNPEAANLRDPATMTPEEYDRWYCTPYPSSVAHQIGEAVPGARAGVVTGITRATRDLLGRLRRVLLAVAAVCLVGAALGVAAVMTATVLERRLEAGLLVALGAESWRVALFFLAEAVLLGLGGGLAGGVAGLAAGRVLGEVVFGVAVPWAPVLLPAAATAGIALGLAGAAAPVARLFRLRPALTLRRATA
ncbi:MAG TPA: ABC transporter permease [Thermoanaerobaculia bacterium]|nr:ABC transporter permease [Thermoanaerobaculia bacterium]